MKGLLILDIQNDFTAPGAKFPVDQNQAAKIIGNINRLTANIGTNKLIPVYIGNEFSKWDLLNIFRNFAAIKGSEGSKTDKRLHVVNQNYFSKNRSSAFANSAFEAFLKSKTIDELYVAGLFAEGCVWGTVKEAVKKGYKVTVLSDCIASATDKKRETMIEKYKNLGVKLKLTGNF
ncbi:MAG: isochorismatase family cysteine hydrolase [Sphingobacteriales bacterium]